MVEQAMRRAVPEVAGQPFQLAPALTRFVLRAQVSSAGPLLSGRVPLSPVNCRSASLGEWHALWLGPDEQLLIGPDGRSDELLALVAPALGGVPHSLVDISHRQCAIEIKGPLAIALINAGCPLDLDEAAFPVGACTRTIFAKTEIVLWRRDNEHWHVEVWRSFVPYLTGFLAVVAQEYGT